MVVFCCFVVVCCNFVRFKFTLKKIEALVELRKMLLRKKLYHVRFGNYSTPKVRVLGSQIDGKFQKAAKSSKRTVLNQTVGRSP